MHFAFDEDQESFRESLGALLADRVTSTSRRAAIEAGEDRALWQTLVAEMGIPALHIAEDLGGQGFTIVESAVVATELGRALAMTPVLSTTLALEAVVRGRGSAELIAELAAGDVIGTIVGRDERELATPAFQATGTGELRVTGEAVVIDGLAADIFVVPIGTGAGTVTLAVVDARAGGVTKEPVASLDGTRPLARVQFADATVSVLPGEEASTAVVQLARLLLAFESIGIAERCLELAVDYAKTRKQFNRAIGSFQAIKHKCADVAVEIDLAVGAAMYAVMLANDGDADAFAASAVAKAQASEALGRAAAELLQILGGIGFTWEHDAHLFFRRAKANEVYFGTAQNLRLASATVLAP